MISPYIPYSKRHGIDDENLAHLLDYLERVEAWDIEITRDPSVYWFDILHKWWRLHIDNELSQTVTLIHRDPPPQKEKDAKEPAGKITFKIYLEVFRLDIFYKTFRTLLPEIRNIHKSSK